MSLSFIISFPRSGQHLTSGVLEWLHEKNDLNYGYCEFYNCCRSVPCEKGHNFQKNHDFWLYQNNNLLKIIESHKYLVLYREDIISQLEAYYRYDVRSMNRPYIYSDLIGFIQKIKNITKDLLINGLIIVIPMSIKLNILN